MSQQLAPPPHRGGDVPQLVVVGEGLPEAKVGRSLVDRSSVHFIGRSIVRPFISLVGRSFVRLFHWLVDRSSVHFIGWLISPPDVKRLPLQVRGECFISYAVSHRFD